MANVTETVIITAGTNWIVPNTWSNSNNTIICIGGGAGGGVGDGIPGGGTVSATSRGGGGGGARSIATNVYLGPNSTITIAVGAGGSPGSSGGDTSFNNGIVLAKGGSTSTSATGGSGGQAASGTGNTKYSGGNGGNGTGLAQQGSGGGGGAAGNTASGTNGSNASAGTGGNGGAGGATDGGNGGLGAAAAAANGSIGFNNGSSLAALGENFAGGGGGGGGGDGYGLYNGGVGAIFGGGGGGGFGGTGLGAGAQGCIIATWTWQSVLPTSGQIDANSISIVVKQFPFANVSINDSNVRTAFGKSSGQIAYGDGYGKYLKSTVVGTTTINTTASTLTASLPSGWQAGDLAVLFLMGYGSGIPTIDISGWTYMGANSRSAYAAYAYYTGAFYRVLQSNDTGINATVGSTGFGGQIVVFRGPSKATALQKVDAIAGTTLTFTGITKSSSSKSLLSFVADRDNAIDTGYTSNPTVPTGWTAIARNTPSYFAIESAWIDSASYTNSTSIQWTNFYNFYGNQGILIELE